jgi:CDGSH-type Zn-finger protein
MGSRRTVGILAIKTFTTCFRLLKRLKSIACNDTSKATQKARSMKSNKENNSSSGGDRMKIKVSNNGPYIVSGGIPLIKKEIHNDSEGYCSTWHEVMTYPLKEQYALCRCGQSKTKPFCDGMHTKIHFDGKETADDTPYLEKAERIDGPTLSMTDADGMCVHARFCMRAGGIWNLIRQSDNPEAREIAIEEAGNCPSGRLVVYDNQSGEALEPEFEKSIVIIEYPPRDEHGPLWVRGGIPVEAADGKVYEIRNRMTLCRCGESCNKPFCDGSHVKR